MQTMKKPLAMLACAAILCTGNYLKAETVFQEVDGLVAVEAEHFTQQTQMDTRAFHLTTSDRVPEISPDGDPSHVAGASGGAYLEILPDTRRTHADKLIHGTNFQPTPGKMAVLTYKVNFNTPGRYYVWARAHSTGPEDNGLHVGLDGKWPETGQRMQWCTGKQSWYWESKQRTEAAHCGEAHKIYLDIDKAGEHTIHFSMREDGFEFDKWLMTTDREFERPADVGPKSVVHSGDKPQSFKFVPAPKSEVAAQPTSPRRAGQGALLLAATAFETNGTGFYLDQGKWLAVNPDKNKTGETGTTFPFPTGLYDITLRAVGENDGGSTYSLKIDGQVVGKFQCPLSDKTFEEGSAFHKTFKDVQVTDGAIISVLANIGSTDGLEFSRARWSAVAFTPADAATKTAAAPHLAGQVPTAAPAMVKKSSPTKNVSNAPLIEPRQPNGAGTINISGELKQWHKVTVDLAGPYAHEQDNAPNPFTDYAYNVTFTHADGDKFVVPGYFAADGNAANTSAESGTCWRALFAPNRTGKWQYQVSFRSGDLAALDRTASSKPMEKYDGLKGSFTIASSDKSGRDLRGLGRLEYVGKPYLQFAQSKDYFIKAGADAPETLLGYADFDGTVAGNPRKVPLKSYSPHLQDWADGDPTWQDGKGKGLIGAVNYLSSKGCNAFSFLTYNAGGDGDNVWPFIQREDKLHYDCSKLEQWGIVFDHATALGMYLHFKMQETEIDDHSKGTEGKDSGVPESLDGGDLGTQRKLYVRELIARYSHNLALNWNIGEENTQSTDQINAMLDYITELDPYQHNRVLHTFPGQQDKQYRPLLGDKSNLTGVSLQNSGIHDTHVQTVKWATASDEAGKAWIVAFDESGTAAHGQAPDLGYKGYDGHDRTGKMTYTEHEVRKQTLWGTLMGGGAGVEYYFGYQYDENDLVCEDWRSRDRSWDYCRIAIEFFQNNNIPFVDMRCQDALVGNTKNDNSKYCLAAADSCYVVYLPEGGTTQLDLSGAKGKFTVAWYNPVTGGPLQQGSVTSVQGGGSVQLGDVASDKSQDWVILVRKAQ